MIKVKRKTKKNTSEHLKTNNMKWKTERNQMCEGSQSGTTIILRK